MGERLLVSELSTPDVDEDLLINPNGTGEIDANSKVVKRPVLRDIGEDVNPLGTVGNSVTIDVTQGNVVTAAANGLDIQWVFTGAVAGKSCSFVLILLNGGSVTITYPVGTKWIGGVAPTLTAAGEDVLAFFTLDGGASWYGVVVGLNFGATP